MRNTKRREDNMTYLLIVFGSMLVAALIVLAGLLVGYFIQELIDD